MDHLAPAPVVHTVRVKGKVYHPWSGRGYPAGYTIDGTEGKVLVVARGESYLFEVHVPNVHPFYFTESGVGGFSPLEFASTEEPLPRDLGPVPTTDATVRLTIFEDTPETFFYQCAIHKYMGGEVRVVAPSPRSRASVPSTASVEQGGVVLAPTHGTVEHVTPRSLDIYIAPEDEHGVFAPISGHLLRVESERGEFMGTQFQVPYHKTERVVLTFQGSINVTLWIEVGKPQYITDNVRFSVGAGTYVRAGDHIGDILLGSRAGLVLSREATITARRGQHIRGGKDTVGEWSAEAPPR